VTGGGPLDEDERGVVLQPALLVVEHGGGEPAQRLRGRDARSGGVFGELDQLVFAEEHPVLVAGLGDPVGVDEQAVTGFELLLRRLLPALRSADAEGGAVRALQPLDDVPAPDQQRGHVPGR